MIEMHLRKNKILLIQDDVAIMDTLSMFLHHEGYEVSRAINIDQAVDLIECSRPDLILLDCVLEREQPDRIVDGLREKHGDRVVVIMLAVPFELEVLLRNIRESLDRQRIASQKTDPLRVYPGSETHGIRRDGPSERRV